MVKQTRWSNVSFICKIAEEKLEATKRVELTGVLTTITETLGNLFKEGCFTEVAIGI